uniref:Pacifastin domain-containing protein n=1 Tax=Scylla olivacea TaxID=85551 RepID=A0A0P4W5K6_SCYOL
MMKAQVVVVLVMVLAFRQAQQCEEGTGFNDGCNTCSCIDGHYLCTMRACLHEVVIYEWCSANGEGGWLKNCHWCKCDTVNTDPSDIKTVQVCTREASCFIGSKVWPECSGDVHWQEDCNTCHCTNEGVAVCTKKRCQPEE